jgi:hypothetical protein
MKLLDSPWRPDNPFEQIRWMDSHRLAETDENHNGRLAYPQEEVTTTHSATQNAVESA